MGVIESEAVLAVLDVYRSLRSWAGGRVGFARRERGQIGRTMWAFALWHNCLAVGGGGGEGVVVARSWLAWV